MYCFELIVRQKTNHEKEFPEKFDFRTVTVSGVDLIRANSLTDYKAPWINTKYVKFWIGKLINFSTVIEVEGVILLKVNDFPYYPKVSGVQNFGKNRISITKIQKRNNHEKPSFILPKKNCTSTIR